MTMTSPTLETNGIIKPKNQQNEVLTVEIPNESLNKQQKYTIVLFGFKGVGKSTLLRHLQRFLNKKEELTTIFRLIVIENILQGLKDIYDFGLVDQHLNEIDNHLKTIQTLFESTDTFNILSSSIDLKTHKQWKRFYSIVTRLWTSSEFQNISTKESFHSNISLRYLINHMELYLRPNYKYTDYDLNHLYIPDCFDVQKSFEYNDINLTIQMLPHTKCTIKDIESITSQINSPYVLIYAISLHDCLTLQTQSEPQSTLSFIENLTTSSSTKNASHTFVVITKWDTLNPKQFITHSSPTISSENTESIDIARNIRKIFSKYFTVCFTSCHDKLDIDNYFELVLTIIKNIEGKTSNTPTNTPTNNPQPLKVERGHQYLKYSFKEKKKLKCQSGGASEIGVRATNEDTFSLIDNTKKLNVHQLKQTKCSYYAIFDGHNGLETSKNCLELMHQTLFGDIDFESGYFESSLMNTYHLVDWKLCNGKINDDSGTTAVTAIIKDRYLIVGNVGDSECIVAQTKYGMDYEVLTYKHTAKDADEKIRMKNNGGILFNGRVYGSLAVSRSLGDRSYKGKGVVIADPFTKVYELTSKDTFIVLACDGVFEQLSYDNVIEFVAEMQKQGKTPQETANALITESIEKGSKDNSTAIIIYLNWD